MLASALSAGARVVISLATLPLTWCASQEDQGAWLKYVHEGKIWRMRPNGTQREVVKDLPPTITQALEWSVSLSSDGTRWGYVSKEGGTLEVWVCDADGRNAKKLTDHKTLVETPEWSRDGKRIAFGSTRSGKWQIWQMNADGSSCVQLTDDETGARQPRFSPVEDRFAYEVIQRPGKLPSSDLVVADLKAGKMAEKHIVRGAFTGGIAWDPVGQSIAYSTLGKLSVYSLAENRITKTIDFEEISKDLNYHVGENIVWRPDSQGLAFLIKGIGGRVKGSYERDNHILVFPFDGKSHLLNFSSEAHPLRWEIAADRVRK